MVETMDVNGQGFALDMDEDIEVARSTNAYIQSDETQLSEIVPIGAGSPHPYEQPNCESPASV